MKHLKRKHMWVIVTLVLAAGYVVSCTRDNDMIVPIQLTQPFVSTRGTDILLPGNMTTGNANEWKVDKVHSSCLWTTPYQGAAGLLTGRFNQFGVHDIIDAKALNYTILYDSRGNPIQPLLDSSWAFYENEPAKTYLNGYVQINTSNTGEPGRDAGCNVGGMGTVPIVTNIYNLTPQNLAKIKTTEVKFDPASNGYIVTLNLTYQGKLATPLTKSIVGTLKYIKKQRVQFGTAAAYDVFGLQLKFSFNCRDFGITSTSIADIIDIECNINFNNK